MLDFQVQTTLDDGTPVLIRPLRPEDHDDILSGFQRLSPHTRYLRYSSVSAKLTPDDLNTLICQDETKCLALGAADLRRPGHYGMGVARYMRCDEEPNTAEIAIVVVDEYQGRGLGSLMLDLLITIARKNGFHTLSGYVLAENRAMIRMLKRVHAHFRSLDGGMIRIDIPLLESSQLKKVVGL
ncbi:GNAT family N-acetyltransferase [candidate division KSB1 bacterium]|nr:GNAT family N-acetyltransferase [candidate division KSB1 bacterium]